MWYIKYSCNGITKTQRYNSEAAYKQDLKDLPRLGCTILNHGKM